MKLLSAALGLHSLVPAWGSPEFLEMVSKCEAPEYCTISSPSVCEEAAAELALGDTTAHIVESSEKAPGCSTRNSGSLVFNEDLSSTKLHSVGRNGEKRVLCQLCSTRNFALAQGACNAEDFMYPIEDASTCELAAAELGLDDTAAGLIDKNHKPPGCWTRRSGGLVFNADSSSTVVQGLKQVLCRIDPDPWNAIMYTTDDEGAFDLPSPDAVEVAGITFDTDDECLDVDGHAVVVHAPDGTRVGCGVLGHDAWTASKIKSGETGQATAAAVDVPGYTIDSGAGVSLMSSDMTAYNAYGRALVLHASDGTRIACGCCVEEGAAVAMEVYPDYGGSLSVTGTVMTTSSSSPAVMTLEATLSGLESSVMLGLHVHTGTSCDVADDVGGHLYDTSVAVIGAYPDYDGYLSVSGTTMVGPAEEIEQGIVFSAYLVDNDNDGNFAPNDAGGVHIHTGTSCDVAGDVGGHFYSPVCATDAPETTTTEIMEDPWNTVFYNVDGAGGFELPSPDAVRVPRITFEKDGGVNVDGLPVVVHAPDGTRVGCGLLGLDAWTASTVTSDAAGSATGATVDVPGYTIDSGAGVSLMNADMTAYNAYGRAVVLHASDGTRIACGCCVEEGAALTMETYPGYEGGIDATGTVTTTSALSPAVMTLEATLTNLENSATLGLHVHTGTSCDVAEDVGGHLFDTSVAVIGAYPGYDGEFSVSGTAAVAAADGDADAIIFSAYLVDDDDTFEAGSSGGVHIHHGTSCDTVEDVQGHYFAYL